MRGQNVRKDVKLFRLVRQKHEAEYRRPLPTRGAVDITLH